MTIFLIIVGFLLFWGLCGMLTITGVYVYDMLAHGFDSNDTVGRKIMVAAGAFGLIVFFGFLFFTFAGRLPAILGMKLGQLIVRHCTAEGRKAKKRETYNL